MTSPMRMMKILVNSAVMGKMELGQRHSNVRIWEWESIAWEKVSSGKACGCLGEIGSSSL